MNELAAHKTRLKALDARQQQQNAAQQTQIQRQKQQIAGLQGQLSEARQQIAQLRADIAPLRQQVAELKAAVAKDKQEIARLQAAIAPLKKEVADLRAEVAKDRQRMATEEQRIAAQTKEIATQREQIAYLEQHQGVQQPNTMVISTYWSCPQLRVDVYALSTFRPGVVQHGANGEAVTSTKEKPLEDLPFNPAAAPQKLVSAGDATMSVVEAPANAAANDQADFVQWVLLHGDWRQEIRLFYVLRAPLSVTAATFVNRCLIQTRIAFAGGVVPLAPRRLTNAVPVALAAVLTWQDNGKKFHIEQPAALQSALLTPPERAAVAAWMGATRDERDPAAAVKEGRVTPVVLAALKERWAWLAGLVDFYNATAKSVQTTHTAMAAVLKQAVELEHYLRAHGVVLAAAGGATVPSIGAPPSATKP